MKRSRVYVLVVYLVVVALLTACAAQKADSCPTTAPQSCPTAAAQSYPTSVPQSCPTAAAQAMPTMNAWRVGVTDESNVIITFEKDDKCSMQVVKPLIGQGLNYEIVVNDPTYQNYMVIYMTLDPGKTLADLQAWTVAETPPFTHSIGLDIVNPPSRTGHAIGNLPVGQLYFTCLVQGPGGLKIIGSVGPVQVPAGAP